MADTSDTDIFTLGKDRKACDVYKLLANGRRQAVCDMGRRMAELTIPSVMPPLGYHTGDDLPGNNQSLGAHCVNTLTSHLGFMAFPPGQPIFRPAIVEHELQKEINDDPELWSKTQLALSRLEMAHRTKFATFPLETAYTGYMKLLLVAGNALWKHLELKEPSFARPDSYVVKRNKAGVPLLTIHEEVMAIQEMDQDHRDFIMANLDEAQKTAWADMAEWEREVTIQSVMKFHSDDDGESWLFWQEYEGKMLPGTNVETDEDNPPMWPGWLIPVFGEDWGRSYCEEYRGDLYTMEAHASAINDGASLAALALLFVKPGSTTSIRQVREAKNLSTLPGDADTDLSVFRTDKSADFNFVLTNLDNIARRLSQAFLLQSSVVRNAERVTKEEIQRVGQELDKALGGLYTTIAQGNQKTIIVRAIRLHEDTDPKLPELPQKKVSIEVITGKDGLGQSLEIDRLKSYAKDGLETFPKDFEAYHNAGDFFRRLASAYGVKPDGLVRDDKQVAADKQAAQQQQLSADVMSKAAGPAAKGLVDMASQGGIPGIPGAPGAQPQGQPQPPTN